MAYSSGYREPPPTFDPDKAPLPCVDLIKPVPTFQDFLDANQAEIPARAWLPVPKEQPAKVWHIVCVLWEGIVWFWLKRLWSWCRSKNKRETQLDAIGMARTYEDWIAAAEKLDGALGYRSWRTDSSLRPDKHYQPGLIIHRRTTLEAAQERGDIIALANAIQSGLVRNIGNINSPQLYNRAYGGTKREIERYVEAVVSCVNKITNSPTTTTHNTGLTEQDKLNILHNMKHAYGQSALVLQGGAVFGLCHLGVVKALQLRRLLPKVISGTATGALIAALVGIHTESELLGVLSGSGINIEAFTDQATSNASLQSRWYRTLIRRMRRWWTTGHFLDIEVLERLLQVNIGDMTFQEAHEKTGRILNITVTSSTSGGRGTSAPTSLNYITAPNVLIRSAALASNATSSSTLYRPVTILCKNFDDAIIPWPLAEPTSSRPRSQFANRNRQSPLLSLSEHFGVNHYILSQARPYLAPFLRTDLHQPNPRHEGRFNLAMPILRRVVTDVQHYLAQLDKYGLVPGSIRRFLLDEDIPGEKLLLVPELAPTDFFKLLENPNQSAIDYWIQKGERSVWPAVSALNVRCGIEIAIDRGYETVKRRPGGAAASNGH